MRAAVKRFDRLLRRSNGVFEFTDSEWCIFRLQLRQAPTDISLADGTFVGEGEPILGLHLWNEQIPPMGPRGPSVAWGVRLARLTVCSLQEVACWVQDHCEMGNRRLLGGATVLLGSGSEGGGVDLMRRLGFEILPYRGRWGRISEFWENLYAWGLMWAYNEESVRRRPPSRMRRVSVWMPIEVLLARYGSG